MEKLKKAMERIKDKEEKEKKEEGLVIEPLTEKRVEYYPPFTPVYTQSRKFTVDPYHLIKNKIVSIDSNSPEIEYFKVLRTRILHHTKDKGWNTIMITSPLPKEGKTLTAINLAITFSKEFNHTVLLVDCDLRQQSIHKLMGIPNEKSLVDALVDDVPLQEIIVWPGIEKFTVISGSRTTQDASELLGSVKMQALLTEIKTRYPERYVFFDLPPLLNFSDGIAFAPFVDAIILVVMAGRTPLPDVQRALELIPREKFLGFVFNKSKFLEETSYSYGYYARE
ncbi:MAG: AAA family ATPase [Deltaproteobacteria bacterium]|nr:AAA family ATPase [Deltaproteobacteria bacterium]